jgi:hypothetical protein
MTVPRRVLVRLAPERSSYNAALVVAGHLREHGHSVAFAGAGVPELEKHAERHGIEHLSVGPSPVTYLRRVAETRNPLARLRLQLEHQRAAVKAWEAFARAQGTRFELAFCDVVAMEPSAFALSELRIPTLVLIPNYGSRYGSLYPPVFSTAHSARESPAWPSRLRFLLAWGRVPIVRNIDPGRPSSLFRAPLRLLMQRMSPIARTHARTKKNGWRFCYSEWGMRYAGPEVVIGHRALDWPFLRESDARCYLAQQAAPRLDLATDWRTGLDPGKTLVYCNSSTLLPDTAETLRRSTRRASTRRLAEAVHRYFAAVIDAFRERPEWQLVVACGGFAEAYEDVALPSHIRVFRNVPQLEVLQHADLVITPGGAGTVRECATAGVPMIVFPMWTDQFGNAARVQHFKLGIDGGSFRRATRERIAELAAHVLDDSAIAAAVARAKAGVVDREAEWQMLRAFVERHTGLRL